MADTPNDHSGSRWEPDPDQQHTQRLAGPVAPETQMIPGLGEERTAGPAPKRRVPKIAAAVAIVAAATIAGGAVGLAVAGNATRDASDTTVTESTADSGDGATQDGIAPRGDDGLGPDRDGDGYGPGGQFGHHGPGGH